MCDVWQVRPGLLIFCVSVADSKGDDTKKLFIKQYLRLDQLLQIQRHPWTATQPTDPVPSWL